MTGPIGDDDIQAAVDGRIDGARRALVEEYLAKNPEAAQRLESLAAQRAALRERLAAKADAPIPSRLRVVNILATRAARRRAALLRIAAALLLVVAGGGGGWVLRGLIPGSGAPEMTREAIAAHRVFVVERRHPVEVASNEEAHLVQWLSNRLGRKLTAPDLAAEGWRLMGGRLLPAETGPAAQLMYEDGAGQRMTVYLRPGDGRAGAEFRYAEAHGVGAFWWAEDGLGYAVSGPADRSRLLRAAQAIHAQIAQR